MSKNTYICNMKIKFKNGDRILVMKVIEKFENGSVKLIDGSIISKEEIIEYV